MSDWRNNARAEDEDTDEDEEEDEEEDHWVQVKLEYQGELTILNDVDYYWTYDQFKAYLEKECKTTITSLHYYDEDKDAVIMKNDRDVRIAFDYYYNAGLNSLKCVVNKGGGAQGGASAAGLGSAGLSSSNAGSSSALQATMVDSSLFFSPNVESPLMQTGKVDAGLFAQPGSGPMSPALKSTIVDSSLFMQTPPPASSSASTSTKGEVRVVPSAANSPANSLSYQSWTKGKFIGHGSSGKVFEAIVDKTGERIAVKEFDERDAAMSSKELADVEKEIQLMSTLSHPNIVNYRGTTRKDGYLYILMELVEGGSLESLIKRRGKLPEKECQKYTKQMLKGLKYLHSNGIIHRDIKAANILVTKDNTMKLADFGCSRKLMDQQTATQGCQTKVGTPLWMAPELISGSGYGRKSDIWSLGCTVLEMATGKPPWSQLTDNVGAGAMGMFHVMQKIATSKQPPGMPMEYSSDAVEFCINCFQRDTKQRPDAFKLLQVAWMAS